jgi:uncharacterized protein YneF (UPF0154 family)
MIPVAIIVGLVVVLALVPCVIAGIFMACGIKEDRKG